jgi:L-ascorbate metabolism protein UlaG (beta-lactamase superfamily)
VRNATTLITVGGITILADPNFLHHGQHAHLGYGLVFKRLHGPALRVQDVPPVDLIVLSHLHADHWGRVPTAGLDRALPVLSTAHAPRSSATRASPEEALARHGWVAATVPWC